MDGAAMIKEGCTSAEHWKPGGTGSPSCGIGTGNWKGKQWGLEELLDIFIAHMSIYGNNH